MDKTALVRRDQASRRLKAEFIDSLCSLVPNRDFLGSYSEAIRSSLLAKKFYIYLITGMCFQPSELYSACRCLYYQHIIDRCAAFGRPGHPIQNRTILVGSACHAHSTSNDIDASQNKPSSSSGDPTSATDSNFVGGYFQRAAELGSPSFHLTQTAGPRLSPNQLVNNMQNVNALEANYHLGKTLLFFLLHYVLLDEDSSR